MDNIELVRVRKVKLNKDGTAKVTYDARSSRGKLMKLTINKLDMCSMKIDNVIEDAVTICNMISTPRTETLKATLDIKSDDDNGWLKIKVKE